MTVNKTDEKFYTMKKQSEDVGELTIYGAITRYRWDDDDPDTTAHDFKRDLDALGDVKTLKIYINSPGGQVFQGLAIYNMLKRHEAKKIVYIDSLAASIASIIALAGDEIRMYSNSLFMIHNASNVAWGTAADFRKAADDLDRIMVSMKTIYLERAGDTLDDAKLTELLDAETWLSAQECLDYGFCDVIEGENSAAACVDDELFALYRNIPEALKSAVQQQTPKNSEEEVEQRRQLIEEANADLNYTKLILGGLSNEFV